MFKFAKLKVRPLRFFCTVFDKAAQRSGLSKQISQALTQEQLEFIQNDMDPYVFSSRGKISDTEDPYFDDSQMAINLLEFYDTIDLYHKNLVSTQIDGHLNKKLNQFISKSAFNLDRIDNLRELVELGYKIEAVNGRSAVFWYFFWQTGLKFCGVWETIRKVEDGTYYEPEDIQKLVKDTPAQDKLDFLGFWIIKQLRDPAEELVLDHLNPIINNLDLEHDQSVNKNLQNLKVCLYLIETGNAELVEHKEDLKDGLIFNESLIKTILTVSFLEFFIKFVMFF